MSSTAGRRRPGDDITICGAILGPTGPTVDVHVADGRVAAIIPGAHAGTTGRRVDASGKMVLPGLWDAHVHMVQWATARRRIDLAAARSATHAADMLANALRPRQTPPHAGEVVVGYGYRDALWPDAPHAWLLERAAPGIAVALQSSDLHTAWLSPAALRLLGRPEHPTGILREQECFDAMAAFVGVEPDLLDQWVLEAAAAAAARGVTGILDFEYADTVADWSRRAARGRLPLHVTCSIARELLPQALDLRLRTGRPAPGAEGDLEVGPVKLFTDGSLNTRTALCDEPYPPSHPGALAAADAGSGHAAMGYAELVDTMEQAAKGGIEAAVHAIGDTANGIALDAFEHVAGSGRIEHAQLLRPQDLPRFARLGLTVGIQPAHCPDDRDVADRHWIGRTNRAFPYADLLSAGATVEIGSDAPVSALDPWDGIASAISRTDDQREPWHPEQRIPLVAALRAASRGRGSVRIGDVADLILLDRDPAHLSVGDLRHNTVHATMRAGRWTHRDQTFRG